MSDPNFFIVGAPKTGTTALCQYLSDHENIFLSEPKELFFWNTDFPGQVAHGRCKNLESYLKKFADARPAHKAVGEGSTHYFVSETAIRNLMTFNPKARVIAMLRNPIDVAYAYHGELVFNFMETEKDFETAWRNQGGTRCCRGMPGRCPSPHNLAYADFASYAPQLERLFEHVPPEQRLVLIFDDMKSDVGQMYRDTLAFLGLPDDGRTEFEVLYAARKHRYEGLMKFLRTPPKPIAAPIHFAHHSWKTMVPPKFRAKVRGVLQKPQKRPALSPEFRAELAEFFRSDLEATSRLLGRDLTHWLDG